MENKFLLALIFLVAFSCDEETKNEVIWKIDQTSVVGGNDVKLSGNPKVVNIENGKAVEFDGQNDGLLVDSNPIYRMEEFTFEVDIKPYPGFPENREQRFLHIQDPEDENRRILIELRLNSRGEWYGDWYVKTENEAPTLIDSTLTHPANEWATIALTYKDGTITGYINGKEQLSGDIKYLPIGERAKTSIGTRMEKILV